MNTSWYANLIPSFVKELTELTPVTVLSGKCDVHAFWLVSLALCSFAEASGPLVGFRSHAFLENSLSLCRWEVMFMEVCSDGEVA